MNSGVANANLSVAHKLAIVSFAAFLVLPLLASFIPSGVQAALNQLFLLIILSSCIWMVLQKKIPFLLGYQDLFVFITLVYITSLIYLGIWENDYGYQKLIKFTQVIVIYCVLLPRLLYSRRAQNAAWTAAACIALVLSISIILTSPLYSDRTNFLGINPIWVGRFCGIISIYCACSYIYSQRHTSLQCLIGFLLGLLAVLLTGSKGPFLGVIVAVGLLYLSNKKQKSKIVVFISLLAGAILYVFFIGAGDLEGSVLNRFSSSELGGKIDEGYRNTLYEVAIDLAKNNYYGFGSGGFIGYTTVDYPHNIFLEIAVEFGLIAMSVFVMFVALLIFKIFNLRSLHLFEFVFLSSMFVYEFVNSMVSGNITSPRFLYLALVLIPTVRFVQGRQNKSV